MFDNLKARIGRMADAWTDKGDGKQYPEGAENSQHSGDFSELSEKEQYLRTMPDDEFNELHALVVSEQKLRSDGDKPAVWVPGELPGGVKIRTNKATGEWEKV